MAICGLACNFIILQPKVLSRKGRSNTHAWLETQKTWRFGGTTFDQAKTGDPVARAYLMKATGMFGVAGDSY